jgi:hypothetical protein
MLPSTKRNQWLALKTIVCYLNTGQNMSVVAEAVAPCCLYFLYYSLKICLFLFNSDTGKGARLFLFAPGVRNK